MSKQSPNVLLTDLRQAKWLDKDVFKESILYDIDLQKWHAYTPETGLWPRDKRSMIPERVQDAADAAEDLYMHLFGVQERLEAVRALLNGQIRDKALGELRHFKHYKVNTDEWDKDRDLIGCANGVLDQRRGVLLKADEARGKLVTMSTGLPFTRGLVPERFLAHMKLVQPDPVMRAYLLRTFGYMMTGETGEQAWWFWYGPSAANGKTQTADAIRLTLGDYGVHVQPSLFIRDKFKKAIDVGSSIHALRRARMGDMAELSHVAELDSELLKRLVEGNAVGITYRPPYGDRDLTAHPPVKLIGHGNSRPQVTDSGSGFWRRVKVIPWDQVVPEDDRIPDYGLEMFKAEGPAILSLLAREAQTYYAEGLAAEPAIVKASTDEYRATSDHFATWVNEAVLVTRVEKDTDGGGAVFDKYEAWCNHSNIRDAQRVNAQDFPERFMQATGHLGVDRKRTNAGWIYVGLVVD